MQVIPMARSARAAQVAVAWAAAEGWNPGLDDGRRFLAADPDAFLATERDGEIVASVSCALYGPRYAFIGFYIVRPDLRGRGLGRPLFDRALARADGRVVGLDAVLEQESTYARCGFVTSHRNVRWRTVGGGRRPAGLVDVRSLPVDRLVAYDAAVFGSRRARFLRAWIDRPPGHALAYVRDGALAGYGLVRACRTGAKVGPLLADDADAADAVLTGLLAAAGPGTEVFIDMPTANPATRRLLAAHPMEPVFDTARMYRQGEPVEDLHRIFGVTTLEFG
ncbi:MAG TPA: GNAT family N-acetyltransferase [Solirubrobacteraceae bacterium]|nr:GNAT family N-acetyltransferase [Solirubrobacteraceae bacterium]